MVTYKTYGGTGTDVWADASDAMYPSTSSTITWTTTASTTTDNITYYYRGAQWATPSVEVKYEYPEIYDVAKHGIPYPPKEKGIHPQLYFKYVKSKMNKLQQEKLKDRLTKLQKLVKQTKAMGQKALHEEFASKIAEVVKESEICACGIQYSVPKEIIQKYRYKVRGDLDIRLEELKDYDRVLPAAVVRKIRMCRKLGLFDKYWVLYIDHKEKTDVDEVKKKVEKIKTTKEKIKEKDPILFGTHDFNPDTFYFVIDWIDEYCDLTIDKFVNDVKKDDPEFGMDKISAMNKKEMDKIVDEVKQRKHRLSITNPQNYKRLMQLEEWKSMPSRIKDWASRKWRDLVLDTQIKEFDKWKRNLSKERREARWKLLSVRMEIYLDTAIAFVENKWNALTAWCVNKTKSVGSWFQNKWEAIREWKLKKK